MMEEEIKNSVKVLKSGGTLVYPTDTIWGIGCDATNSKAVNKIYKLKKRSKNKNLIVLIDDKNKLENYVKSIPEIAWGLIDNVDKPLTIIYPEGKNLAKNWIMSKIMLTKLEIVISKYKPALNYISRILLFLRTNI